MIERDRSLFELFGIEYENTLKLTFHVSFTSGRMRSQGYVVFLKNLLDKYKSAIRAICQDKLKDDSLQDLTLEKFCSYYRRQGSFIKNARFMIEDLYRNILGVLRFPYILWKNEKEYLPDEELSEYGAGFSYDLFRLYKFLEDLYANRIRKEYEIIRTVTIYPNDILFLVNDKVTATDWIHSTPFKMGCYMDSPYVRKIYSEVSKVSRSPMKVTTPVYYCRFGANLGGTADLFLQVSCPFDEVKQSWVSLDEMCTALNADGLTKIDEYSGSLVAKIKSSVEWLPLTGKVDVSDDEINKLRINGGVV